MSVTSTHRDYDRMAPLWSRCRDVTRGQDAVHKAGVKYLPKLEVEGPADYQARLKRSDFTNYYWRTVSGLVGMAFRKEPAKELPGALKSYAGDITLSGVNADALAELIVEEVLEVGRIGLLVDHPSLPDDVKNISQGAADRMGHRPFVSLYPAESIRNWKFTRIDNAWKLGRVVLAETIEIAKDEFEAETEDRYRVLDLDESGFYRQRVFVVKGEKDVLIEGPIYPHMNGKPMREIPFSMVGRSGKGDTIDEPPLIDLADANIAHYQVNSDYRHGLHFTALPTLFLSGMTDTDDDGNRAPIYIGGTAAITSSHPDAEGKFIEYTGQGLDAIKDALAGLERRMAVLGARMLADEGRQAETLGATQIKRAAENSILARIAIVASEAMEWALGIMAQWSNVTGEIKYEINREFSPLGISPQDLTAYMQQVQSGLMSEQEYYALLQRGDVIDATKPFEEHQEEISQQGPTRPDDPASIAA